MSSLLHYNACSARCFPHLYAQALFPSQYCVVLLRAALLPDLSCYVLLHTAVAFVCIDPFFLFLLICCDTCLIMQPGNCRRECWVNFCRNPCLLDKTPGQLRCARCTFVNRHSCGPVFCVKMQCLVLFSCFEVVLLLTLSLLIMLCVTGKVNFSARKENHNACSAHEHFVLIVYVLILCSVVNLFYVHPGIKFKCLDYSMTMRYFFS